jgi:4-amino-4-deoxy-L-arabinose transferase-like glycosyltransferase
MRSGRTAALAVALGTCCFAHRYLAYSGFPNDHFVTLSRAQQILLGEVPVRDFVDPGLPLMYYMSAAFQAVFGGTLLSEAMLVFGALALAAAITCVVAARVTGSYAIAAAVTLMQILVAPRAYGYPKILLYAVALLAIGAYARSRRPLHAVALGLLTAGAFLMRHDHGIFIGAVSLATIAAVQVRCGRAGVIRAASVFLVAAFAGVLPFLILVQESIGLGQYVRDAVSFSRIEAARSYLEGLPALRLSSRASIATGWLFYLPFAAAVAALLTARHWRDDAARATAYAAAGLSLLVAAAFLRSPLSERVADVWGPLPVALACAVASPAIASRPKRAAAWAMLLVGTAWSVVVVGAAPAMLRESGVTRSPSAVVERWRSVTRVLSTSAARARAAEEARGGDPTAETYLFACSAPSDRLLALMFAPELYYFTQRGFAAGHVAFVVGYYGSQADQELAIARWSRQSVPFALMFEDQEREMASAFPFIVGELQRRYVQVARIPDNEGEHGAMLIFADRSRQGESTYEPLGAPCFVDPGVRHAAQR